MPKPFWRCSLVWILVDRVRFAVFLLIPLFSSGSPSHERGDSCFCDPYSSNRLSFHIRIEKNKQYFQKLLWGGIKKVKNKSVLFILVLITWFYYFPLKSSTQRNQLPSPPILTNISPNSAAAGYGQMVTVYGKHLLQDRFTQVTLNSLDDPSRAPFTCSFVFLGASASESLHVRFLAGYMKNPPLDCPNGLHPVHGLYDLTVTTPAGTSNALPIEISAKPGTPVIRFLKLKSNQRVRGEGEDLIFRVGERIIVSAYGIDTAGAMARFEQGAKQIPVNYNRAISSPSRGIGAEYIIPEMLLPGEAQVRIQTRVGNEDSEWSKPFTFQVIP